MFVFVRDYVYTLVSGWVLLAGGLLTLNDIAGRFTDYSWKWPRSHRWKVALGVLLLAQVGAYKSLQDEANKQKKESERQVSDLRGQLEGERQRKMPQYVPENPDHAKLDAELDDTKKALSRSESEKDDFRDQLRLTTSMLTATQGQLSAAQAQLADVQQQLSRTKQAPPVVVTDAAQGTPYIGWGANESINRNEAEHRLILKIPLRNFQKAATVRAEIVANLMIGKVVVGNFNRTITFAPEQGFAITIDKQFTADVDTALWSTPQKVVPVLEIAIKILGNSAPEPYKLMARVDTRTKKLDLFEAAP